MRIISHDISNSLNISMLTTDFLDNHFQDEKATKKLNFIMIVQTKFLIIKQEKLLKTKLKY